MNTRIAAVAGTLLFVLTACPEGIGGDDGGADAGEDGGVVKPGECTGGCGPNQVCADDGLRCISACKPACLQGQICVGQNGAFSCQVPVTSCSGSVCEPGQAACRGGACSCLTFHEASRDTCADQGRVCAQTYNPVTLEGGTCVEPRRTQACRKECVDGDCGACPVDTACDDTGFWLGFGFCNRLCQADPDCSTEEICIPQNGTCYPKSLFANVQGQLPGRACFQGATVDAGVNDAGEPIVRIEYFRVSPGELCIRTGQNGAKVSAAEDTNPTGTCTWAVYTSESKQTPWFTCRPPGPIAEGGTCTSEPLVLGLGNSCDTGLECLPQSRSSTQGVCTRICNAKPKPDGTDGSPGCGTGSACVNYRRLDDPNTVPGACLQTCNVFDPAANHGCVDLGNRQTVCVPTSPRGTLRVTATGDGLCVPRNPVVATEGEPCAETDAFLGGACETGLICAPVAGEVAPRCIQPCDLECAGATPPARCTTQANAACSGQKTCTPVGASSAILGYCL